MDSDEYSHDVLVIGAGIAGMEASLVLANTNRTVHLVERTGFIGGNVIKFEDVYPNLECSTCMIAPKQQELLAHKKIALITPAEIESVSGEAGHFTVTVQKKARYVDTVACIGCGMCIEACPVELPNEFEEGLTQRKAIYVPCAGALPNVPVLDMKMCVRSKGEECTACKESCMFEAIDFEQKDETLELEVGAIIAATGYSLFDAAVEEKFGYRVIDNVYSAFEFERLFASNGPTGGQITLKNGEAPASAAIIHCVGRDANGYCSGVCCGYSAKFAHYLRKKIADITVYDLHTDICIPGKNLQVFFEKTREDFTDMIRYHSLNVGTSGTSAGGIEVTVTDHAGASKTLTVDMVILAPAIIPNPDAKEIARMLGIQRDMYGFFAEAGPSVAETVPGTVPETVTLPGTGLASVRTATSGIFSVGCACGPKNIQQSVSEADAAAGRVLALLPS